ncbi:MAG: hypothetical protein ABIN89_28745 [Chitinophagaceae bacterium]
MKQSIITNQSMQARRIMVEVFKTNVEDPYYANILVDQIQKVFVGYKANFDLEDCDRILRVICASGIIDALSLIDFFKDFGFYAEVLPDDPLPLQPSIVGKVTISNPHSSISNISRN